jgi:short-subunit dehydrogenase
MLEAFNLTGETAIVTGANRGLGRTFALALSEAGANVIVSARSLTDAKKVVKEIEEKGGHAAAIKTDVTKVEDLHSLKEFAISTFGTIDVLINNAGAFINEPALSTSENEWRRVMSVNVDGVWFGCQVIGEHMVNKRKGSIVNIGSISAIIVNRPQMQAPYNISKAAVHHLTKSLAAEWAPFGVRVNAIAPGYMKTEFSETHLPQYQEPWIKATPMNRAGEMTELGPAVVFLASNASSFMTGSIVTIDGGYTLY